MTITELKQLVQHSLKRTAPENFSVESVDKAVADGFKELGGSVNQFMRNKYDIFEILIDEVEAVVPNRVIDAMGMFAEVRQVADGQKAMFKTTKGKTRARKFFTQVGLSGVYETFRLDKETFELGAHAVGGACTVDFDRMIDGAETISDVLEVITDGLTDAAYLEVHKALRAAIGATNRPNANAYSGAGFDADEMVALLNVVRAYGNGAVIFAPPEFIAAMGADAIVPVTGNVAGVYHPQDIDRIHNQGYINIFRGAAVVMLPQSFTDEDNVNTWIDPQIAYVFPTGKERIVKVVFEGPVQMWDFVNRDRSIEINAAKKMGVGIITHNNWAIYQNTDIPQTFVGETVTKKN